jgi:uncharacterized membrane protein YccC
MSLRSIESPNAIMRIRARKSQFAVGIIIGIVIGAVVLIGLGIDIVLVSLVPWDLIQ